MGAIADRVKYHIDGFRDRFENKFKDVKLARRRGTGTSGVKRNKSLYRNGGEFKSRF